MLKTIPVKPMITTDLVRRANQRMINREEVNLPPRLQAKLFENMKKVLADREKMAEIMKPFSKEACQNRLKEMGLLDINV